MSTPTKQFFRKSFTILEKLGIEAILLFFFVSVGSIIFHNAEGVSYFNSVYFSIITLAGVWYGDIVPYTPIGKLIAMFYAVIGIPLFIIAGGLVIEILIGSKKSQ